MTSSLCGKCQNLIIIHIYSTCFSESALQTSMHIYLHLHLFAGTQIERLPSPYTNCVEDKFIWNNDEYISTQYACRKLCLTMVILEKCKCIPETITPYHYTNIGKQIFWIIFLFYFCLVFKYIAISCKPIKPLIWRWLGRLYFFTILPKPSPSPYH